MSLSLARELAYDTYVAVMNHKKKPEEVLDDLYLEHKSKIKRLDRNFVKEVLFGSLRWHAKIYWILQNTSKRDLNKSSGEIRAALVMGTYQIYYMDRVPDRAAVNESVEYVRKKGQANACSFVNGILRQIARRAQYFPKPDKEAEPVEYLALQYSHPEWIVRRWIRHFSFARLSGILAANNKPPPISVRVNTLKTPLEETHLLQQKMLKQESIHTERRPLRGSFRLKSAPKLGKDQLFGQGYYTIQDESSQLVGHLVQPGEGEFIVDACAGPGGKISQIYEMSDGKAALLGIERDQRQFDRLVETMNRLGHSNAELLHQDFTSWSPGERVDKILLDAPCSGLGVLKRHPEGKWQKSEGAIALMAETQHKLLRHALPRIKAGGELIYSVCSFEPEESQQQLGSLLKEYGDRIEVVAPGERLADYYKKYVTRDQVLLVYAGNQDEMDGFSAFVVRINQEIEP